MKSAVLNRWVYIGVVLLIGCGILVSGVMPPSWAWIVAALIAVQQVLTYPFGFLGQLFVVALLDTGIFTTTEAFFAAAPLFAFLGWLQWYVVVPRVFGKRYRRQL